jgi:hypothetical protein
MGEASLSVDSLVINKVSQVTMYICVCVGVVLLMMIGNAVFGSHSRSYMGAALRGGLTGAIGAGLGFFVTKFFPTKVEGVELTISRQDIVRVTDKNIGVRKALEIHTNDRIACVMMGLANQEDWKRELSK